MSRAFSVSIDAADPAELARFWAAALGYELQAPPPPYESWPDALRAWGVPESEWNSASALVDPAGKGPRLYFQRVPEPKTAKNRFHLDVNSGAGQPGAKDLTVVRAVAAELVGHGATIVAELDQGPMGQWIVMTDPEGNEFCVV